MRNAVPPSRSPYGSSRSVRALSLSSLPAISITMLEPLTSRMSARKIWARWRSSPRCWASQLTCSAHREGGERMRVSRHASGLCSYMSCSNVPGE